MGWLGGFADSAFLAMQSYPDGSMTSPIHQPASTGIQESRNQEHHFFYHTVLSKAGTRLTQIQGVEMQILSLDDKGLLNHCKALSRVGEYQGSPEKQSVE